MTDEERMQGMIEATRILALTMMKEGTNPLEVAAVWVQTGLSLYKDTLPPEAYDMMIDTISDLRGNIPGGNEEMPTENDTVH
jgi:hypothetical protein